MPPASPHRPETDTDFMLPEGHPDQASKPGNGAIIGVVIIVMLLIFGALYFWGAQLNRDAGTLPFIPGDSLCTPSATFGPAVAEEKMANGCSICSYRTPIESTGETLTHVEKCPQ